MTESNNVESFEYNEYTLRQVRCPWLNDVALVFVQHHIAGLSGGSEASARLTHVLAKESFLQTGSNAKTAKTQAVIRPVVDTDGRLYHHLDVSPNMATEDEVLIATLTAIASFLARSGGKRNKAFQIAAATIGLDKGNMPESGKESWAAPMLTLDSRVSEKWHEWLASYPTFPRRGERPIEPTKKGTKSNSVSVHCPNAQPQDDGSSDCPMKPISLRAVHLKLRSGESLGDDAPNYQHHTVGKRYPFNCPVCGEEMLTKDEIQGDSIDNLGEVMQERVNEQAREHHAELRATEAGERVTH